MRSIPINLLRILLQRLLTSQLQSPDLARRAALCLVLCAMSVSVLCAMSGSVLAAERAPRTWRDTAGRSLGVGTFHSFPDDTVWIIDRSGAKRSFLWKKLGAVDQDFVLSTVLGLDSQPLLADKTPPAKPVPRAELPEPDLPAQADVPTVIVPEEDPAPKLDATVAAPREAAKTEAAAKTETARPTAETPLLRGPEARLFASDAGQRLQYLFRRVWQATDLKTSSGELPAEFYYFEPTAAAGPIRRWAVAREAERGRFALWYAVDDGWVFHGWTERASATPHTTARPTPATASTTPSASSQSDAHPAAQYRGALGAFALSNSRLIANYRSEGQTHRALLLPESGPVPDHFHYFGAKAKGGGAMHWALARNPEADGRYDVWFERGGYWYLYDRTTRIAR